MLCSPAVDGVLTMSLEKIKNSSSVVYEVTNCSICCLRDRPPFCRKCHILGVGLGLIKTQVLVNVSRSVDSTGTHSEIIDPKIERDVTLSERTLGRDEGRG